MDEFRALRVFVRVVENGSFSKTAKDFQVSQATISKQIGELEENLKTKLLSRTTRSISVTEAGEKLYTQAKLILEQYSAAIGDVKNLRQKPSGTVRLGSTVLMGREFITPALKQFHELYPDIVVEHYVSDSNTDLVKYGIDVTIRVGDGLKDSTLMARKLLTMKRITAASKDFLKKYGIPKTPEDLEKFPCILNLGSDHPGRWEFLTKDGKKKIVNVTGPYGTNSADTLLAACNAGLGILRLTPLGFDKGFTSGNLVRILENYENDTISLYAVTPSISFVPQKTKVLIDFIHREFKTNKDIMRNLSLTN